MDAIVYTSNTGHTAAYARILAEKTGLPVYPLAEAEKKLQKGARIIYLGWLFASSIKGYRRTAKRFSIDAVCGIGLCDTGCLIDEVRRTNALPEMIPLFTMQGGIDKTRLHGINRFMIRMLQKGLASKKDRSEGEARMLELLNADRSYVCEAHTADFMAWYGAGR